MLAKDDKWGLAGVAGIILAWLILLAITLGNAGCGTMAPVVKEIPGAPADYQTNRYIPNPIYTEAGKVANLAPVPYIPQAIAIGTSLLAIAAIWRNRKLKKKQQKEPQE
jgi:hypothetical protein